MMVSAASRMFSAISFGVFCRLAPSTRAIIRSMKVSPGFWVILHDDPVGQHRGAAGDRGAVAAGFADDRGRLAGDRRLVHRGDALDHVAVAGDHLAGLDHDKSPSCNAAPATSSSRSAAPVPVPVEPPGHRGGLGPAQRFGLGLAAAFGHGLGEVGEHHGQPQPGDDGPVENRGRFNRLVPGFPNGVVLMLLAKRLPDPVEFYVTLELKPHGSWSSPHTRTVFFW